jgi:hypothetical protein
MICMSKRPSIVIRLSHHNLAKQLLLMAIVLALGAVADATDTWRQVDEKWFTFRIPAGFRRTNMTGVEVYLGEYYRGETRFLFIEGGTASYSYSERRQPEMHDYREETLPIGGKPANMRTFFVVESGKRMYKAELNVGDWPSANVDLYMGLESPHSLDLELAKLIFRSVRFREK